MRSQWRKLEQKDKENYVYEYSWETKKYFEVRKLKESDILPYADREIFLWNLSGYF